MILIRDIETSQISKERRNWKFIVSVQYYTDKMENQIYGITTFSPIKNFEKNNLEKKKIKERTAISSFWKIHSGNDRKMSEIPYKNSI
jgi:hypothetical protein